MRRDPTGSSWRRSPLHEAPPPPSSGQGAAAAGAFAGYFAALAREWRGWEGERAWASSPREEPSLRARLERTGHVLVVARLGSSGRTGGVWQARVMLQVESGHVDALARAAAALAAPNDAEVLPPPSEGAR